MAKRRITSRPGLGGMVYHYDENGKFVGKSRPGLWGDRRIHYDAHGAQVGTSRPGYFAEEVYHDNRGHYASSYKGLIGLFHRLKGRTVAETKPSFLGFEQTTFDADEYF